MISSIFIIVGLFISYYFFKRYKAQKPISDKIWEFAADLFTGANLLGPLLTIIGVIGLLIELKILK
jgi:hypothetical protein